jgi:glycosyltransferase involved in cell wall biosynthesis
LKIVLITFLYEPNLGGGAAQVVYSLAHSFVAAGLDVTVITSLPTSRPVIERKDGIKIIRFNPRNLYWVFDKDSQPVYRRMVWQLIDIWNPFVYRMVRSILETEKPDLVHVNKLRGLSPSVWNAARSTGVSTLMHTCHDYELVSPEGQLFSRIGRLANNRALAMRPYQYLRSKNSSLVQLASSPSKFVLDLHQQMGYFRNATCRVIPNSHGFTYEELLKQQGKRGNVPDRSLKLLYLGRLVPEKGIEELCQAVNWSIKYYPKLTLDIVGWGFLEDSLRKRYWENKNIHFHGGVFGEEKNQLLRECDLLVIPSIFQESFGVVITEAYAFGKPVLASRIGGIPEIVKDDETGFLVTPGCVDKLSEKICQIAKKPDRIYDMRGACFEAAKEFTADRILNQYLDFYNQKERTCPI